MQIKKSDIFNYAFIAFPVAFASIPIYIFIPEYYHSSFGMNLTVLSVVLFILRALDAIFDSIIGWYCDKFHYLSKISLIAIVAIFITGVYIICTPVFTNIIVNLAVGIFLSTLAFSYITIFSTTKGALWLKDDNSKSEVISAREISNILGVLVASLLLSIFLSSMPHQNGYFLYAIVAIILIVISSIFFLKWINKVNLEDKSKHVIYSFNIKNYINHLDSDGVFLFVGYTISAIGSTLPAVTIIFFSKYILKTHELTGLYIFAYFLGAIVFIPIMKKISLKFGIIKTWGYALLFYASIFSFVFALSDGDYILFTIISFISGAGLATELILPSILLAKWIDSYPERKELGNGYYAMLTFIAKFSYAIATIITFPIINSSFASDSANLEISLRFVYCILPCLFKLVAAGVIFLWFRKLYKNQ
ncbi:major Facilitator Superfamily protein [Francisella philomiragia]|uniref:MFS transporter n=1 Tax=Francisella philomiragia TaxID=28110 RepID=UPI0005A5699F|nr:MFS transporter [Francisella philomiragia]AJI57540.1 major Facilitator Superfamily protein [Francisella philomiragia]